MPTVTIKEVAKLANTSASTVSRVINDLGNVTPEKTQAVLRAIKELDYNPNHRPAVWSNVPLTVLVLL